MATQTLTPAVNPAQFLQRVLLVDGLSCLGSGLLFTLGYAPIAEFAGIAETSILGLMKGNVFIALLGIGLLLFSAWVFWNANRSEVDTFQAWLIVEANFAWVILSAIILLTNALPLTNAGAWGVLILADFVLGVAIAEIVGLRRMRGPTAG